jgi:hypothetical protein
VCTYDRKVAELTVEFLGRHVSDLTGRSILGLGEGLGFCGIVAGKLLVVLLLFCG